MDKLVIGTGYLGGRVAARWQDEGHRVYVTTRSADRAEALDDAGFEPIVVEVLDSETLVDFPSVDTVLYSIGLDRESGRSMREVYVGGLENVLRSLPKPERFLYVSSTGVYAQDAGELLDEEAETKPVEESGLVVLEAEQLLRTMMSGAIVLRFAGIYGPGRWMRQQTIRTGEPLAGDAEKWLNLIHVEDGVQAVLAADERGEAGRTYHVSDDRPCRRREFYTRMAEVLGAPPPHFVPLPADAIVSGHERNNRRISNKRLREELGVTLLYPSFEEGLVSP